MARDAAMQRSLASGQWPSVGRPAALSNKSLNPDH